MCKGFDIVLKDNNISKLALAFDYTVINAKEFTIRGMYN